jgi:hypothetical protein
VVLVLERPRTVANQDRGYAPTLNKGVIKRTVRNDEIGKEFASMLTFTTWFIAGFVCTSALVG